MLSPYLLLVVQGRARGNRYNTDEQVVLACVQKISEGVDYVGYSFEINMKKFDEDKQRS